MEKGLVQKLRTLRYTVSKIKDSLGNLHREKEQFYSKKENLSKKIGELIAKIKELKAKRDSLTSLVKEKKENRDKNYEAIKQEFSQINSIKAEIRKLMKSRSIREVPLRIKQQIEELDFKVQTEGYTFEKERNVMKKIKELQAQLENSQDIESLIAEIRSKWHKISILRKEANYLHAEIRELSAESQKLHEEMLAVSRQIDKIKPQRDEAAEKWAEKKEMISKLNLQLKQKLQELGDSKAEMDRIEAQRIKSKEMEVEAKMKRGERLTTEDLLVFQELVRK